MLYCGKYKQKRERYLVDESLLVSGQDEPPLPGRLVALHISVNLLPIRHNARGLCLSIVKYPIVENLRIVGQSGWVY